MKKLFNYFRELYVLYIILGSNQRKWLLFLKNNPDRQHKGALGVRTTEDDFKVCCLGQAGLMFRYCHWNNDGELVDKLNDNRLPLSKDNKKFLKLRSSNGAPYNINKFEPLSSINDNGTWLDVYNTCINNPKEYFTGKI